MLPPTAATISPASTGAAIAGRHRVVRPLSGNARDSVGPFGPKERSNIVVVKAADNATYTFDREPAPQPVSVAQPNTGGVSPVVTVDLQAVMTKLATMDAKLDEIVAASARLSAIFKDIQQHGLPR